MWLYKTGEDGEHPIVIYQYSETRAGESAAEFLENFDGYLMCDGYSGYNLLKFATRTACYAHIRGYLTEAIPKVKELDYAQPAVPGVMYINHLFVWKKGSRKAAKHLMILKQPVLRRKNLSSRLSCRGLIFKIQ